MAIDAIQRLNEKTGTYVKWRRTLRHDRKWDKNMVVKRGPLDGRPAK